ncbi:MAG: GDP-mannose 4,6-dehydratase [Candidatus Aenigmarchaeota archaeon]|nr:GDP-mannose 4,6-dehydratase [Candidatus Aenigmarchaeota archaeon]
MNILITGGAGFIGSHLSRYLIGKGHKITILDDFSNSSPANIRDMLLNRQIRLVKGDVRDAKLINEITDGIDIIFHLAAQIHIDKSILEPKYTFDVNVLGTLNILEAARKRDFEKIVFASTSEVYGTALKDRIDEDHPLNPQSPYAASKAAADRLCHAYSKTYGMNVSIIRNFNTFGPFQKDTGYGSVIPIFIRRVLENKPPIIYGSGEQTRDFMYIDDAVHAYDIIMNKNADGALNFGSGRDITINDLANLIIRLCGKDLTPVHVESRPGEVMKLCADTSKSRALGFEPKYTLESGIQMLIDWTKKYKFDEWKI